MKSLFNWRIAYDVERDALEGRMAATDFTGQESLTIQGAPDSDINELMHRYGVNDFSQLPAMTYENVDPSYYGDFTDVPDLRTALERVRTAKERFDLLPAKIRARFDNNVWKLHQFISSGDNTEEAIALGLLTREPEKKPDET